MVAIDGGADESTLEEGLVDGKADGKIELTIGFEDGEGIAVVEELAEGGVEVGNVGGADKAFNFYGNFLTFAFCSEEAFCGEVDLKINII